jgi:hypothetical protein
MEKVPSFVFFIYISFRGEDGEGTIISKHKWSRALAKWVSVPLEPGSDGVGHAKYALRETLHETWIKSVFGSEYPDMRNL